MSEAYAKAGVDIARGDTFVAMIKDAVTTTHGPNVLTGLGGFAAHLRIDTKRFKAPILVTSTDGVGTKVRIAIDCERFDTIGQDLVAMCANDLACSGATPLCFLDYLATGELRPAHHAPVVEGIARACKTIDCALVGGETAEMPGMYHGRDFDLAGFVVGLVEASQVIDGTTIRAGDQLVGIASSGYHSNGYTLVRKVIQEAQLAYDAPFPGTTTSVADLLLTPTHLYPNCVAALMTAVPVKGIAHITGGGLTGNIPRILPATCQASIEWSAWTRTAPFTFMQSHTGMHDAELRQVFNCGIGLVVVVAAEHTDMAQATIATQGFESWHIGAIQERTGNGAAITYR